jgi:hypothetical protein
VSEKNSESCGDPSYSKVPSLRARAWATAVIEAALLRACGVAVAPDEYSVSREDFLRMAGNTYDAFAERVAELEEDSRQLSIQFKIKEPECP